jgi:hypothetical protein
LECFKKNAWILTRHTDGGLMAEVLQGWLVFKNPPEHTRLRQVLQGAFMSRPIEMMRPSILAMTLKFLSKRILIFQDRKIIIWPSGKESTCVWAHHWPDSCHPLHWKLYLTDVKICNFNQTLSPGMKPIIQDVKNAYRS